MKVLRPNVAALIQRDVEVLYAIAGLAERYWPEAHRLHPVEVVAEFEKTLAVELDLMREAANAAQLKRNFAGSDLLYVPEIYWDFCRPNVLTMERVFGIQVDDIEALRSAGADIERLAENGVEIFFTQVFRHNFFHADMHPGNIFVDVTDPAAAALRRRRLRHRRHARRARPALSRREFPRVLPPRLPARRDACTSIRAGCRPARASTSSRPPCARSASRSSTSR